MLFDNSDNTVQICEGGVWVDLGEVAKGLGVDEESFLGWASESLPEWNDQLMDAIVDFAMGKIADIYRDETPDGARPDGKAPTDGQMSDDAPQATRRHPRVRGAAKILRDNGWTPEFMVAEWERAVAALADGCPGGAFQVFVAEGYAWDSMPTHLIPKIPGLADRLYEAKARREEKEAEEARAKQAKIDARRRDVNYHRLIAPEGAV